MTLNNPGYRRANSATAKQDKATKSMSTEAPFNPDQLEFLKGPMNATTHMASNGNVGDEYILGSKGPKSTKKAKAKEGQGQGRMGSIIRAIGQRSALTS